MSDDQSMVDRVAEAIWDSQAPEGAPPYHHLNNMEKFQVSLIARDCIKAMREPTNQMSEAASLMTSEFHGKDAIYQAMIDAALEEN